MTGAVMPAGLDTVVPQEFVPRRRRRASIVPAGVVRTGDNRRLAGEDLARGEAALRAGRVLRPADLGLLASLGQAEVPVLRRLRVAFFSTGDELRSIGEPLDAGCVYDSNRYTLLGHAAAPGRRGDRPGRGARRPGRAARPRSATPRASADAVITSGGVSVGEADHTKQVHGARSATCCSGASRCGRAADGDRPHRQPAATTPSCSACPATRWR